jgi:hypothetical protein
MHGSNGLILYIYSFFDVQPFFHNNGNKFNEENGGNYS